LRKIVEWTHGAKTMKIIQSLLLILATGVGGVFCDGGGGPDPHTGHPPEAKGDSHAGDAMAPPESGEGSAAANAVMLAPGRIQEIGIRSEPLIERELIRRIRAVGVVRPDERRLAHVHLKFSGFIEHLYVDFVGRPVRRGETLFTIYSPELFVAQNEYLSVLAGQEGIGTGIDGATGGTERSDLLRAVERKLELWDIGAAEIAALKRTGEPIRAFPIRSPISGLVLEKEVFQGMSVDSGMELYLIADLSRIWLLAEVYEMEIALVRIGQRARLILEDGSAPITGRVTFIDPVLNEKSRTAGVRFEFPNPGMRLRPGMFGTAEIELKSGRGLAVPVDAVIDTGTRKIIYLDVGEGRFEPREVALGPKSGDYYPLLAGVEPGTRARVVTSGQFLLDSESRLQTTSPGGGHAGH
jgi:Cu(I)/Ag(I) efflux system membrane fusion protein